MVWAGIGPYIEGFSIPEVLPHPATAGGHEEPKSHKMDELAYCSACPPLLMIASDATIKQPHSRE